MPTSSLDTLRLKKRALHYFYNAAPDFETHVAKDGERLALGAVEIDHVPWHTMESTTYLLRDEEANHTQFFRGHLVWEMLGGQIWRKKVTSPFRISRVICTTARNKMTLPDETIVYPGHGAGSAFGKNMARNHWESRRSKSHELCAARTCHGKFVRHDG